MTTTKWPWKKKNKQIKICQSQSTDMTFWTSWRELLFSEISAKMIDGSEKHNRWLSKIRILLKGPVKTCNWPILYRRRYFQFTIFILTLDRCLCKMWPAITEKMTLSLAIYCTCNYAILFCVWQSLKIISCNILFFLYVCGCQHIPKMSHLGAQLHGKFQPGLKFQPS